MARDTTKVYVGADGLGYVGATGSTAPTTATAAPAAAFKDLGWISEDGLTESSDLSTNEIKGMDGTVVRKVVTGQTKAFQVTFLETNGNVLGLYYGANSTIAFSSPTSTVTVKAKGRDLRSFIFDVVDGAVTRRFYIPTGEVTDVGEIKYSNGEAIAYQMTITAYPDTSNVVYKEFVNADLTPA